MEQTIKLDLITDLKELKALAYDQLGIAQRAQVNIQQIEARIAQVIEGETQRAKAERVDNKS